MIKTYCVKLSKNYEKYNTEKLAFYRNCKKILSLRAVWLISPEGISEWRHAAFWRETEEQWIWGEGRWARWEEWREGRLQSRLIEKKKKEDTGGTSYKRIYSIPSLAKLRLDLFLLSIENYQSWVWRKVFIYCFTLSTEHSL